MILQGDITEKEGNMNRESMIVRVPVQTKNDIVQIAKEQGVTVNGLVNHLFYELVEQYKKKEAKSDSR